MYKKLKFKNNKYIFNLVMSEFNRTLTKTTNDCVAYSSEEMSEWVTLWLVMGGTPMKKIQDIVSSLVKKYKDDKSSMCKLLVLIMRLRDIRNGGHGRRLESRIALLSALSELDNDKITTVMLKLYASYFGRWDDLNDIIKDLSNGRYSQEFKEKTLNYIYKLWADTVMSGTTSTETIGAYKWFPKERNNELRSRIEIGKLMFPTITEDTIYLKKELTERSPLEYKWHRLLKSVRIKLSEPREKLDMVECKLCSDNADEIDPGKVPGVARKMLGRAFENKISLRDIEYKKKSRRGRLYGIDKDEKRSYNQNRIQCADNFQKHAKKVVKDREEYQNKLDLLESQLSSSQTEKEREKALKAIEKVNTDYSKSAPKIHGGSTVYVHELVLQYLKEGTSRPNTMIEAQFTSLLDSMSNLDNYNVLLVPDTSASMGEPKNLPKAVAIGLSALFASLLPKALRHKCIAFSDRPYIFDLSSINGGNPKLVDYINYFEKHSIVSNTNIQSTIDLISGLVNRNSCKLDLILFISDCQFDRMTTAPRFSAGEYCKSKIPGTQIAFWNVNGIYLDSLPAEPSETGVVMLSGFNQKMLLSLMDTINVASQIDVTELKKHKEDAKRLFEETKLERQRQEEEEKLLNTYQMIFEYTEGENPVSVKVKEGLTESGYLI
jgi:hypothetical protein